MRMIVALAALSAAAASALPPLRREPVMDVALPSTNPPVQRVRGARIGFAPGQPTGLHRHPVPVIGVVTRGSFRFQPEGEPPRLLRMGDSFFEPAGRPVIHFDNASPRERAEIVAFYLTDSDARPLIDLLH